MRHLEDQLQEACVRWMQLQHPRAFFFAIPNGARTSIRTAVRLKKTGMRAGVPDLFISEARCGFHGLYVEMKSPKGSLSTEQKKAAVDLKVRGYAWIICRDFATFRNMVNTYLDGGPL
jgi:hypothetical protein